MSDNIKIFRPKRKYNQPRYAKAVKPFETFIYSDTKIQVTVTNRSKKIIYFRRGEG